MIILMLLLVPVIASGQDEMYTHHQDFPFIIITSDTVEQLPEFTDQEFYAASQGVIFRVNRTEIPADDRFLKLYRDSVLPWVNQQHMQLRKVFIRGAASPEGSYANNQRLGKGRSQALLDELRRNLLNQYIETDADISCITEDYGYLCLLMKNKGDKDYERVQRIFDECNADEFCCKRKLMADKPLWNRLLQEYFPQLRAARLVLWFSKPDKAHAPRTQMPFPTISMEQQTRIAPPPVVWDGGLTPAPEQVRYTRRHLLAVRTNLLHDFFYMPKYGFAPSPNLQLEYYPLKGHLTYNLGVTWSTFRNWDEHRFYQVRDFQLELRRYFKGGGRFMGFYLGAVAEATVYGIGLDKDSGWEGEGAGLSLSAGYVAPLTRNKHLRIEFMLAAGAFISLFDPYVYGNPITKTYDGLYYYDYLGNASSFKKRNHRFFWLGPTNAGIQLTYDILYRKRHKVEKGGTL